MAAKQKAADEQAQEFEPTIVYSMKKLPAPVGGSGQCDGGTYFWLGVSTQAELDDAIDAGWKATFEEASASGGIVDAVLTAASKVKKPVPKPLEPVEPEVSTDASTEPSAE